MLVALDDAVLIPLFQLNFFSLSTDQKKTPSVFTTARKDIYNQDQDDLTVNQQHIFETMSAFGWYK